MLKQLPISNCSLLYTLQIKDTVGTGLRWPEKLAKLKCFAFEVSSDVLLNFPRRNSLFELDIYCCRFMNLNQRNMDEFITFISLIWKRRCHWINNSICIRSLNLLAICLLKTKITSSRFVDFDMCQNRRVCSLLVKTFNPASIKIFLLKSSLHCKFESLARYALYRKVEYPHKRLCYMRQNVTSLHSGRSFSFYFTGANIFNLHQ